MTITFVAAGTATTANNAAVTPGAIAGIAVGDLVLIQASIRNAGTGSVNTPTGWVLLDSESSGAHAILARFWEAGDALPSVTFTGGAANADTIARAIAFRGVAPDALTESTTVGQTNGSAANIAYPAFDVTGDGHCLVMAVWKQDDASAYSTPAGWNAVGLTSTTIGDDASQGIYYKIETTESDLSSGSITVTGGASAVSSAIVLSLHPAATLTVDEQDFWPPRVLISLTGVVVGLDTVEIYRSVAGVETLLRAGQSEGIVTDPSFLVVDGELPFGVAVTYVAIVNGSARYESAPVTYTLIGGKVAVSDAITGDAVETVIMAWDAKDRDRNASVFRVGGRNVVVVGDLGQFEGDITFFLETDIANAQFQALLAAATEGVLQIRQPGPYAGVDCYIVITTAREERFSQDGSDPRREWTVHAVEVDGWAPALEASGFTLQDVYDFYGAAAALTAVNADFTTLLQLAQADFS